MLSTHRLFGHGLRVGNTSYDTRLHVSFPIETQSGLSFLFLLSAPRFA